MTNPITLSRTSLSRTSRQTQLSTLSSLLCHLPVWTLSCSFSLWVVRDKYLLAACLSIHCHQISHHIWLHHSLQHHHRLSAALWTSCLTLDLSSVASRFICFCIVRSNDMCVYLLWKKIRTGQCWDYCWKLLTTSVRWLWHMCELNMSIMCCGVWMAAQVRWQYRGVADSRQFTEGFADGTQQRFVSLSWCDKGRSTVYKLYQSVSHPSCLFQFCIGCWNWPDAVLLSSDDSCDWWHWDTVCFMPVIYSKSESHKNFEFGGDNSAHEWLYLGQPWSQLTARRWYHRSYQRS